MRRLSNNPRLPRENFTQGLALMCLLAMAGFAIAGPSGILAWSEQSRTLDARQQELAKLKAERDDLRNRVELLDPRHADPDLTGELLRSDLNVVHPDEMMMLLK